MSPPLFFFEHVRTIHNCFYSTLTYSTSEDYFFFFLTYIVNLILKRVLQKCSKISRERGSRIKVVSSTLGWLHHQCVIMIQYQALVKNKKKERRRKTEEDNIAWRQHQQSRETEAAKGKPRLGGGRVCVTVSTTIRREVTVHLLWSFSQLHIHLKGLHVQKLVFWQEWNWCTMLKVRSQNLHWSFTELLSLRSCGTQDSGSDSPLLADTCPLSQPLLPRYHATVLSGGSGQMVTYCAYCTWCRNVARMTRLGSGPLWICILM